VSFEWDEGNLNKNLGWHGVANQEAEETFFHEPRFIFEDTAHSAGETRYLLWSMTAKARKLSVIFTIRGNKIRIISARDMSKKERRVYEEKIKINTEI